MNKIPISLGNNILIYPKEEIWLNEIILFLHGKCESHLRGLWKQNMHDCMYVYIGICVWLLINMDVIPIC